MSQPDLYNVLQILMTLGGFYVLMRKISGAKEKRQIGPQPFITQKAPDYVTQEACGKMHSDFDRRLTFVERRILEHDGRLDTAVQRLEEHGESRASKIHARIDGLADRLNTAVGEIKGEIRRIK